MCFSCQVVEVAVGEGCSIILQRDFDPFTQPTDFDLGADAIQGFLRGDWGYVGLLATAVDGDGALLGSAALYGVVESAESPCALADGGAVEWVVARALGRVAASHAG